MTQGAIVAFEEFAALARRRLNAAAELPVFLLRTSQGGRPRRARALFARVAAPLLRDGDVLAYERGGTRFAVGMFAPSREGVRPAGDGARGALTRVADALRSRRAAFETLGWTLLRAGPDLERIWAPREHDGVLATVSHELRTPLTSIRGYIETLLDDELDPGTARRFLETARREALRMGRLVESLLACSLLDAHAFADAGSCDAGEQIRATIDAAVPIARERRITLRARVPASAPARIGADACVHALLNLVENAIKHGRSGGVVELGCRVEADAVVATVDDDGPGIAESERDRIFAMGVRGAGARRPGGGIGLAVVQAIVRRAGGSVAAAASPLGGARFVLRLPRA